MGRRCQESTTYNLCKSAKNLPKNERAHSVPSNYTKIVRQFPSKVTNVAPSSALKVLCGLFGSWEWMDGMPVSWFWSHFVREYFYSWHFSKIDLVGNTMGVRFIWWLLFRPGNVQFPTGQDSWQICVCDGVERWDGDVAGLFSIQHKTIGFNS